MNLTARQKELLRSLPRDGGIDGVDVRILPSFDWDSWDYLLANTFVAYDSYVDSVRLTPAGQAEWDKLQEETSK